MGQFPLPFFLARLPGWFRVILVVCYRTVGLGAVLFLVTALWGFGGIGIGAPWQAYSVRDGDCRAAALIGLASVALISLFIRLAAVASFLRE